MGGGGGQQFAEDANEVKNGPAQHASCRTAGRSRQTVASKVEGEADAQFPVSPHEYCIVILIHPGTSLHVQGLFGCLRCVGGSNTDSTSSHGCVHLMRQEYPADQHTQKKSGKKRTLKIILNQLKNIVYQLIVKI